MNPLKGRSLVILADKIMKLRKQAGWSQEDLAMKLDVSRQSVSKWESASSIPDLNRIISLADIFGVSTDYLLKDEVEVVETLGVDKEPGVRMVGLEEATRYVEDKLTAARITARGVFMIICGVMPLMILLAMASQDGFPISSDLAAGIGILILLVVVAISVGFFIKSSQICQNTEFIDDGEFDLEYGVHGVFKEKLSKHSSRYVTLTALGVALFILCPVPLIISGVLDSPDFTLLMMVAVLLFMVAVGVFIVVPVGARQSAYKCILQEGEYSANKRSENKRSEKLGAFYWPLVVAIYLAWSFITMDWGRTWIVWPIAGVGFAAFVGLIGLFEKE